MTWLVGLVCFVIGGALGWAGGWIQSILYGKAEDHEVLAQVADMLGQIEKLRDELAALRKQLEEHDHSQIVLQASDS